MFPQDRSHAAFSRASISSSRPARRRGKGKLGVQALRPAFMAGLQQARAGVGRTAGPSTAPPPLAGLRAANCSLRDQAVKALR